MRDILPAIQDALERQTPFAWARVVSTWGSAPRRPGAAMLVVSPDDHAGSVSGGCVEHAVIDEALASLVTRRPQLLEYGIRDETAWSAGLSCGGSLTVLVEPFPACSLDPATRSAGRGLLLALNADRPVVLATPMGASGHVPALLDASGQVIASDTPRGTSEPAPEGSIPAPGMAAAAASTLDARRPMVFEDGDDRWFLHPFPRRDRLFIVGGSEIAVHLVPLAHSVEFETVLIDPRRVLADGRRFLRRPDHVFVESPEVVFARMGLNESTYVVLLTHDPSVDDPALRALLQSPVAYIGALGGKTTHEKRRRRLSESGHADDQLERVRGPVGLPIGAETPAEIAVSIVADLVRARREG